jgi:NAD(P)-dependent dehydrogenase (short-subunit alcohol dehydrogenase family)
VVVVAGAGSGLGAATACRLGEEGVHVVVGDIALDAAEQTAGMIRDSGGSAIAVAYDATDQPSVHALAATAVSTFGRIDGWHNNAADTSKSGARTDVASDALNLPLEVWERTFDVNLRGYLYGVRAALPLMLPSGAGAFVHTSSNGALIALPNLPAYNATKAGVISLSRHVAKRWGREGIRSNVICPGYVRTGARRDALTDDDISFLLRKASSHRIGAPSDVAAAAAFLLSSDAEWINGQVISVDGGQVMR